MRRGEPVAWGMAVTILLHAGAALGIALGHGGKGRTPGPAPEVMVARLVRLGTPRPAHLLPRKPAAPPPPVPVAPVVEPAPEPEPPKPPEPATDKAAELRSAMARARALAARNAPKGGDAEPEGRPEGVPEGTADTAAEGDAYATEIWRRLHEAFHVPEVVSERDLPRLRALVFLRLAEDGRILEYHLVEPSGNRFFDASTLEAVQSVDRLPPPPASRAKAILGDGLLLEFNGAGAR